MTKNAARKELFRKKEVVSQLSNEYSWRERREDFIFEFKGTPSKDPQLSSKLFGPSMNTVQWEKTVRRSKA